MNKCLLLFFVVILMLVSCSPMLQQEGPIETVGAITSVTDSTNTIVPTKTETPAPPTPTARETDVPTSTETPALSTMEILMRAVLNAPAGSEEYMAADKAFVEYMNANTPQNMTVNLDIKGTNYEIAWVHDWYGPGRGAWRWVDEAEATGHGEAIDRALDSIPGPFIEGGIDEIGNAYAVDPETGEKIIVPNIKVPGLDEMSLVQLLKMDPVALSSHFAELISKTDANPAAGSIIQNELFPLPVFVLESYEQNKNNPVYASVWRIPGGGIPIDENIHFRSSYTATVLFPLYEASTEQILGWTIVTKGERELYASLIFTQGGGAKYEKVIDIRQGNTFGAHSGEVGLVFSRFNTDEEFKLTGEEPLLELGENVGSSAELREIADLLRAGETQKALELAQKFGFFVSYPPFQAH